MGEEREEEEERQREDRQVKEEYELMIMTGCCCGLSSSCKLASCTTLEVFPLICWFNH